MPRRYHRHHRRVVPIPLSTDTDIVFPRVGLSKGKYINRDFNDSVANGNITTAQVQEVLDSASQTYSKAVGNLGTVMCCILILIPVAMISFMINFFSSTSDPEAGFPKSILYFFGFLILIMFVSICLTICMAARSQKALRAVQAILNQQNTTLSREEWLGV